MLLSGDIEVHLTRGPVRHCDAVKIINSSAIAIWTKTPNSAKVSYDDLLNTETGQLVEPDVILKNESWERIERGDTAVDPTSSKYLETMKEDE